MTNDGAQPGRSPSRAWPTRVARELGDILGAVRSLLLGRRRVFVALVALVLLTTGLEALGIALIMPLMAVLEGPPPDAGGLTGVVVDAVGASPQPIALLVALAFVLKNALTLVRQRWSAVVLFGLWEQWVRKITDKILFAAPGATEHADSGGVITTALVETRESVRLLFSFLDLIVSVLTFSFVYVVLLLAMWEITLGLTVVLLVAVAVGLRPISAVAHRSGVRAVRAYETASGRLLEILGGLAYVKAFGREKHFAEGMAESTTRARDALTTSRWIGSFLHPVVETAVVLLLVSAILLFARLSDGQSSRLLPLLGVFTAASFRLFPVLTNLGRQWVAVISRRASVDKVVASLAPYEPPHRGRQVCERLANAIAFRDVHFCYPTRVEPALDGVSLELPRGHKAALVGESGAGKSTILSMLLGFLRPDSGAIEIDGVSLEDMDLGSWRARIGYVGQDGFIFHATLGENITLGRPTVDGALEEVVRVVGLEDLVASLPEGCDAIVGEKGARLSGGQRQRVALARALYARPEVLVLDEAMNALDNESVASVMQSVGEYLPEATWLVVGHRLSTTAHFDAVFVLRRGKVVEQGTHNELIERNGYYKHLYLAELAASPTENGPEVAGNFLVTKA